MDKKPYFAKIFKANATMRLLLSILLCFTFTPYLTCGTPQKQSAGKASYYSDKLHGRKMSNGEKYHRDSLTCAHLHYPLGTLLKVRNPLNDKEVIVRVTDRGPYAKRYIIDLSKAAARELGFIRQGFCTVEITPLHPNHIPFRPEEADEIPELQLEYQDMATFPVPVWKQQQEELRAKKPEQPEIKGMGTNKKKKK